MTTPDYRFIMDGLDENDAALITTYWSQRFGWVGGTTFGRRDVGEIFEELNEQAGSDVELTDELWARITQDPDWPDIGLSPDFYYTVRAVATRHFPAAPAD